MWRGEIGEKKREGKEKGRWCFFHPIPLFLFPSCYKLRERCWVSAEPVLVGWRGVELKLLFHGGKRVGKEGETLTPGWIPCCRFSVSGLDVAETSAGCAGPVPSSASPNPGVSPSKRHPQLHNHQPATHPSPLSKDWEEGRIFQPVCAAVFSFPHPRPAIPLGFLNLAPSAGCFFPARWFFLLGSGGLLGDEAL